MGLTLRRVGALLLAGLGPEVPPLPALIEMVNRALRPLAVLSVFALIAAAFVDPPRYIAGMLALRHTPWPLCALVAAILGLHFLRQGAAPPPRS
ncbi:hypothetical protein KM031_01420 [Gemmobacter fulvus]|uniref:Uncharacterized protein n=1 Tax=Gemmobacter fulvus TaxID=2840474 RepID=A0A975S201_9RHOB|nr:hypothetical protein [Gemmobacter fulvus]MBT9245048.1 hypothetical protein [Gemmobacter fulvus]MDQ1847914.1 hypothetical protein [Gemmobacter fulvus]QWK90605.1 hypothetical protein KM031_01420 [Gemmobacter fulvus]